MESGSAVVGKDERTKKYNIYVEEYVLSYLRRESDSLELSEIYFYGSRQGNGRKIYVYGAGREKKIAAFKEYEMLPELICRLTQAGPVFLVREPDGECRTTGFQVFYDNNEAMQNYLLEWTGTADKRRIVEKTEGKENTSVPVVFPEEKKKRTPHGAMSMQLCLILVVLVAIVITSADSYDKMEELNRSAKEVFFAIENQEAEDAAGDSSEQDLVVERNIEMFGGTPQENGTTADVVSSGKNDGGTEEPIGEDWKEESVLKSEQESVGEIAMTDTEERKDGQEKEQPSEQDETESADMPEQNEKEGAETAEQSGEPSKQGEEENEEALSRSITRYYEVEQGDTLYTISEKIYGDISRVEKICEVNQISDPDKIRSGQRIILP